MTRVRVSPVVCVLALGIAAACSSNGKSGGTGTDAGGSEASAPDASTPDAFTGAVRVVTHAAVTYAHYTSIQAAVDAASQGDVILIDVGTYNEGVVITTPGLHLRGIDRNGVVLDGQHQVGDGIVVSKADGVTIENLTVHDSIGPIATATTAIRSGGTAATAPARSGCTGGGEVT
jgi:pectin methylesterase-like acyl-CoA thioesterase